MIIHKLIASFLRSGGGSPEFYGLQARDAVRWLRRAGAPIGNGATALDLGCGYGDFGAELARAGCEVTFADDSDYRLPNFRNGRFLQINLDQDELATLGAYDLVICSNVLEHLGKPERLISGAAQIVRPGGCFYLSWTNWLSPWGGHEFSPFHYLGTRLGPKAYERLTGRRRIHRPYVDLFPTYIGQVLRQLRLNKELRIVKMAPRYYPELALIMNVPWLRELLAWNAAILLRRKQLAPEAAAPEQ